LSTNLPILYKDPIALNSKTHTELKLGKFKDYAFAAKTNSIQIVGVEFIEAAKEYPIVFIKLANGSFLASTLNGLKEEQNLYLNSANEWDARYIPAYVRRYPFIISEPLEKGEQVIFIDQGSDRIQKKSGDALFNKDGSETAILESAKAFLQQHYAQSRLTDEFCQWLAKEDLFMEMTAKFEIAQSGENFLFNQLYIINEAKLIQLPADKVMELFTKGWLGWVYAHLISLTNFSQLVDRYSKLVPVKKEAVAA
jgi:hypothetical protein